MSERIWNEDQSLAISSFGGNILVSAAAGSGKTSVLVERVIRMLTDEHNPVDADKLLIVTFTRLAAGEMKNRINEALAKLSFENPDDLRLSRQLLLMERAHIGTIHSFCTELVRENAVSLGLQPDPKVAEEDESEDIASLALEETVEEYYKSENKDFFVLTESLGGGRSDSGLSQAVLQLYKFVRAMPHFEDWLSEKAKMYNSETPIFETEWGKVVFEHAENLLKNQIDSAKKLCRECEDEMLPKLSELAQKDITLLEGLLYTLKLKRWNSFCAAVQTAKFDRMPVKHGADEIFKEHFKTVREEYKSSVSKTLAKDFSLSEEDFAEDMRELAPQINCLFALTLDFARRFEEMKREKGLIDFGDLEQFSLKLLTEKQGETYVSTPLAKEVSQRFDYILVDECQDNNEVQESILKSISKGNNLFFVGDVKQSIYRFRQAMPELFLQKRREWGILKETGAFPATVILGQNYRSRKNIAGAVNFIFRLIMTEKGAEIDYNKEEELVPKAEFPEDGKIRNELLLIESEDDAVKAEAEAVAEHICQSLKNGETVYEKGVERPLKPSDICILLRSASGRTEKFLSAIRAKGISCKSENDKGFLSRPEVAAVIDVLKAVDNPLLDIPLAGAMLSELFLFTPDDLAEIRAENKKIPLYNSVKIAAENGNEKARDFIEVLAELRKIAAYESSDRVIERLYELTSFPNIMRSCPGGELRLGNLRLLVKYAADREKAKSHGLSSFIRFITRLEEREKDLKPVGGTGNSGDSVRVMSVHGSKGLEFPVVYLCGTAKQFNMGTKDNIKLHPRLGFGMKRRDRETKIKFDTLPWIALKHELRSYNLAEEMRIIYVALTRPKEKLVITYCDKNIKKAVLKAGITANSSEERFDPLTISSAASQGDWLLSALMRHPDAKVLRLLAGISEDCVLSDETGWEMNFYTGEKTEAFETEETEEKAQPDMALYETLVKRSAWEYPFKASQNIPAKAGVSSLTHGEMHKKMLFSAKPTHGSLSGADRGTALHTFMQFCDFGLAKVDPKAEIQRLKEKRFITEKQAEVIDQKKLEAFFNGSLYKRIEASPKVWRELRFLRALSAKDLGYPEAMPEDKITVQGVADCVFEENGKLVVVDYKTDFVDEIEELRSRYSPQLNMYKKLLTESMGKPVTEAVIWSFRFGKEIEV